VPDRPATRSSLVQIDRQESKLDVDGIVDEVVRRATVL
jgi:hypothetical protein